MKPATLKNATTLSKKCPSYVKKSKGGFNMPKKKKVIDEETVSDLATANPISQWVLH